MMYSASKVLFTVMQLGIFVLGKLACGWWIEQMVARVWNNRSFETLPRKGGITLNAYLRG